MPNLRQINFGGQGQQIAQQQSPKSIMAQLLLQRASQRDNTAGAGIRSGGENILGALLQKQAFEEQQDRLANQQANMADTIKGLFPEGTVDRSIPSGPGLPDVDERIMRDLPIQESDVGAPDPLGVAQLFDTAQSNAAGGFNTTPPIPEEGLQVGQQFQGKSQKAIDFANQPVEFQESVPNQLGQMLQSFNRNQPGGLAPGAVFGVAQQQQAQQAAEADKRRETFQVDLGDRIEVRNKLSNELVRTFQKGATPGNKLSAITSQLNRQNQKLISDNTISSREKIEGLKAEVKAGERVKVSVLLGNDEKSGRPITQVGFAKKSDPTDIKFIGQPTISGAGSSVNVSNLPQIPSSMLTAITGSNLGLKQMSRIKSIIDRLGVSDFGELVGPWDNVIGSAMEKAGIPNKDQQSIKTITTDMTDLLGRLRSGGVISEQEWKNFRLLVPQRSDNMQTFINKMGDFNNKMSDILSVNLEAAGTFGFNTGTAGSPQQVPQSNPNRIKFDAQGNRVN